MNVLDVRANLSLPTGVLPQKVKEIYFTLSEAVLNDPRFVNCMGEAQGPEDPNFVAVFAKCYSFAGRPR